MGKKFDPAFIDMKKVNKDHKKINKWIVEWFANNKQKLVIVNLGGLQPACVIRLRRV